MSTAAAGGKAPFQLPDLPYAYDALEPHIDARTMEIHHTKHHATYVKNLNGVLQGEQGRTLAGLGLDEVQRAVGRLPPAVQTAVRNNGGGAANHSMFWTTLAAPSAGGAGPAPELGAGIERAFGSLEKMQSLFNTAAATRFGSGWAWLCLGEDKQLFITSTPNQDNPLMKGVVEKPGTPILGLDVWEHAYYLKYQNRRPDYIKAFWNVVNWDKVSDNFDRAVKGDLAVFEQ